MTTHRIRARPPRGPVEAPPLSTDPDTLRSFLEDAAHFPGGQAAAVAFPRTEGEVAALVRDHERILPIGAQSSVTGGATPRGEVILSTARLAEIGAIGSSRVRVQPGVPIAALLEALLGTAAVEGAMLPRVVLALYPAPEVLVQLRQVGHRREHQPLLEVALNG